MPELMSASATGLASLVLVGSLTPTPNVLGRSLFMLITCCTVRRWVETTPDVVPFEWGAGKGFNLSNDVVKQVTLGAVGYAQWQATNNQIDLTPRTKIGASAIDTLEHTSSEIYSAGPEISLLTKYGLFSLRYYEEFGAHATPSGRQLMFSVALAFGHGNRGEPPH
jgi:hypothetical protein